MTRNDGACWFPRCSATSGWEGKEMTQLPIARDPLALPRDAKLLSLLLESLGVCDSDPAALHMLLEFGSRHLTELLSDASLYADHAERRDLTVDDVRLAVEGRALTSFTSPPSKDFMLELADKKNSLPLPSVPQKFGLRLPVDRHTLTAPTLTIVPAVCLGLALLVRIAHSRPSFYAAQEETQ